MVVCMQATEAKAPSDGTACALAILSDPPTLTRIISLHIQAYYLMIILSASNISLKYVAVVWKGS